MAQEKIMKTKLIHFLRAIFGRAGWRIGLDARPLHHIEIPLMKLHRTLRGIRGNHQKVVTAHLEEAKRLHAESELRLAEVTKVDSMLGALKTVVDTHLK